MDLFTGTGSSADDHLDHAPATASLDDVLLTDLKELVHRGSASEDRSQQRDLGPSEVGDPCLRKLAYKMMDEPKVNPYGDPLPSVVGTGAHAMLEEFARRENTRLGRVRWIPETRVTIRQGLAGTCDLYDIDTKTVVDHKFPGTSRLSHYRSHGPSDVYRRQAHLYGRGYRNLGLPVERVAICFWPRGGQIRNTFLWSEPYSDEIVEETTARIDSVILMIHDFDVEHHPANYAWIPATSGGCFLCPYYQKSPTAPTQCDGKTVGAQGIIQLAAKTSQPLAG